MVEKQQVVALIQCGQWTKAKEMCSRLCEGNPDDPEAWFYLAGVNSQLNLMEDVIECCQKVLVLQPNNIGAYYNLGVALQSTGCHAEAATAYKQVIVIEPLHALAYANLGLAERVLGKTDDALASCAKALQLRPELTEALNTYALALRDQGKLEQAVEYLLKAIKYSSSYADAHFNLGLCYEGLEHYPQAEDSYQQAIASAPPTMRPMHALGRYWLSLAELTRQFHITGGYWNLSRIPWNFTMNWVIF